MHCDDGTVCPAGTRCGDPEGCISPGDCGDGVISGDEVCDDGNTVGGDGCAATCRSFELCGNGIVDGDAGEECDDGNHASHDGCSSGCLTETLRWQDMGAGPPPRTHAAMTWDPDRGRVVMTGGYSYVPGPMSTRRRPDTWYWSQRAWMRGPDLPFDVTFHAMASDNRGAIVLFGGETEDGGCANSQSTLTCRTCMLLDDNAWAPCATTLPFGRYGHVMTTSPGGGVVVFGGTPNIEEPWQWRAGTWTMTTNAPQSRSDAAAAYDPIANRSLVFGGSGPVDKSTTAFDGTGWTSTSNILSRISAVVVYDSTRRRMIAFGGQPAQGGAATPDNVLDWTGGADWHDSGAAAGPSGRFGHVMAYDPIEHGALMFGGQTGSFGIVGDTWLLRWDSATPDDACDGSDADGDGRAGCADEDCWALCTPHCPPGSTCDPAQPHCGDGVCNPYLEDAALCPDDC